jgi:hypothetical protein
MQLSDTNETDRSAHPPHQHIWEIAPVAIFPAALHRRRVRVLTPSSLASSSLVIAFLLSLNHPNPARVVGEQI